MVASPEDQALIELWRQGDESAARRIVETYMGRLLQLARRRISERLARRVDPEDIVQSVFRTFFTRAREGQFVVADQDDLCRLLMRITLHKTLRQVAFHRAAKRNPGQEAARGEYEQLLAVLDREPTPEASVAFLDQLEHFLDQLGPQERAVLELRLQGCGTQEIADKLGLYDRKIRRVLKTIQKAAEQEGLHLSGEVEPAD